MIWSALVEDAFATPVVREDTAARIRLAGALCTAVDGAPSSGPALARLVRAGQDLMSEAQVNNSVAPGGTS
ncbi:hypothetical protein ACQKM2_38200 [Streptomyces sp. NPDC004126]|uniref:hypothetical protein n=1 Tax=Streptomyces sp. NPDC004126 TaxID=3390695 RepID=UPI003CFE3A1E